MAPSPGAWPVLMSMVGVGGAVMTAALLVYLYALLRNLLPADAAATAAGAGMPEVRWGGATTGAQRAWTGPLAVAVLVGLTVAFTALAFELMRALPVAGAGSAH